MATIPALTTNEGVMQKEKVTDASTPDAPRPTVRIKSPGPEDVSTVSTFEVLDDMSESQSPKLPQATAQETESTRIKIEDEPEPVGHRKRSTSNATAGNESDVEKEESDNEGEQDGDDGNKKKKGQRFFCSGYPPCNLSFTRSEHLARHIRKHTGERPFKCHCNRRFSRLDNLRQHAQTVHVNEEIPVDSLAATGTRYQRQIRTDRVRPAPRPRTNTASSTGSHSRGHSRNLSTSSVGSTSSIYSNAADARRRPPPLLMASDNRPTTPPTYSSYAAQSPADLSTPTSATFPGTPGSPNFGSGITSPIATQSRGSLAARRLSFPSGANVFQHQHAPQYSSSYGSIYGSGPAVASTNHSSVVTSPIMSTFPQGSNMPPSSEDWRRRTWHPSTYSNLNPNYSRPATSGLTYSQTPDAPHPTYTYNPPPAPPQAPRLPGIESFYSVQNREKTPLRNQMAGRPSLLPASEIDVHRRAQPYDASNSTVRRSQYPEIDDNGRPTTTWGQDTMQHLDQLREAQARQYVPATSAMGPPSYAPIMSQSQQMAKEALELQSSASKRVKRPEGYIVANASYRTSPESSSSEGVPTPGTSAAEIHPTIVHSNSNSYIEPQLLAGEAQQTPCLASPLPVSHPHHPTQHYSGYQPGMIASSPNSRLEALVAVATGESTRR